MNQSVTLYTIGLVFMLYTGSFRRMNSRIGASDTITQTLLASSDATMRN